MAAPAGDIEGRERGTPPASTRNVAGGVHLRLFSMMVSAKLWNTAVGSAPNSLVHQALATTTQLAAANTTLTPTWQPWAGPLAAAMAAAGQPLDLANPTPIPLAALATAGQQRQLQQFQAKAARVGATRYQQYEGDVCGSPPTAKQLGLREPSLDVRQRSQRSAVAQVRTGTRWGAEESGRFTQVPHPERIRPRCQLHGTTHIEDATHMLLHCCLNHPLREHPTHAPPFADPPTSLATFLRLPPAPQAAYITACRRLCHGTPPHTPHTPP